MDDHIHYTDDAKTALEAWLILERIFSAKVKHSKISFQNVTLWSYYVAEWRIV